MKINQNSYSLALTSTLFKPSVDNLGSIVDSQLTVDKQVNSEVKVRFFQLCTTTKPFLTFKDLKKVPCAFSSIHMTAAHYVPDNPTPPPYQRSYAFAVLAK